MAAKGTIAKNNVEKAIIAAFGDSYIGTYDKKIYLWANDGGEQVQIAVSLTCPKNPIETNSKPVIDSVNMSPYVFSEEDSVFPIKNENPEPLEITEQELENVRLLMERLGL